jgi:hypothetical protein
MSASKAHGTARARTPNLKFPALRADQPISRAERFGRNRASDERALGGGHSFARPAGHGMLNFAKSHASDTRDKSLKHQALPI